MSDPNVPDLIVEAYGTVTPPPDQPNDTPDNGEEDEQP